MTLQDLIDWHEAKAHEAAGWTNKHKHMNKHGRSYHDAQAAKHQLVYDYHSATLAILNKHAGL